MMRRPVGEPPVLGGPGVGGAALLAIDIDEPGPAPATLTIGLLVPFHADAPAAGRHFLQGVELGLAGASGVPGIVVDVEVGSGYVEAADSLTRLLDDGAQVVVAAVSERVAELLAPICQARGVGLVVAGLGSEAATAAVPGVVRCTHEHWQAVAALGDWAAAHLDDGLFQVVAAPDAEYDAVRALRLGFEAAGGRALGRATTHDRYDGTGVAEAAAAARVSGARTVAVHASGERLTQIVRSLREAGVRAEIVVDETVTDDSSPSPLGRHADGLYSASAWCRSDSPRFARVFRATTREAADAFAAVGYDAALLVAEAARRIASADGLAWSRLDRVLADVTVDGSRGPLTVDPATGSATTKVRVRRARAGQHAVVGRRACATALPEPRTVVEVGEPLLDRILEG